uniref:Uncharacterized protein n=1 Tax=Heterorhabditis bacteriophora TaxID=37862 RepID=A0A1I7WJ87_HETBA
MPILSKLAHSLGLQILTTNCYETIHTWEPDCLKAILVSDTFFVFSYFQQIQSNSIVIDYCNYIYCILLGNKNTVKANLKHLILSITSLIAKKGNLRKIDWKKFIYDVLRSTMFSLLKLKILTCNIMSYIRHFIIVDLKTVYRICTCNFIFINFN